MAAQIAVEKRNKQLIQAGFDAWRNGTGGVFDLLAADAQWTIVGNSPVSRTFTSRREFLDVVIDPFNARLSSRLVPTVRALYADGDTVIALFDVPPPDTVHGFRGNGARRKAVPEHVHLVHANA